jgi:hypothetical protein
VKLPVKQSLRRYLVALLLSVNIAFAATPPDGTYYCTPNFACHINDYDDGESHCADIDKSPIGFRKLVLEGDTLEMVWNRVNRKTGDKKLVTIKVDIANRSEESVFYIHKIENLSVDNFSTQTWYGAFDGSLLNVAGIHMFGNGVTTSQRQFKCELF